MYSNRSLDYAPEILIKIFEKSMWNLELQNLTSYFTNIHNQYNDLKFIVKISSLSDIICSNKSLSSLSLEKPFLKGKDILTLSKVLQLKTDNNLKLYFNEIGYPGFTILIKDLQENTSILSLNLYSYHIEDKGALLLSEALKKNKTLLSLHIGNNSIRDNGAIFLAEALKKNETLITLNLGRNSIGIKGLIALAKALRINNTLTTLDLSFNHIELRSLKIEDIIELAGTLENNKTLKNVYLLGNGIDEKYVKMFSNGLYFLQSIIDLDHTIIMNRFYEIIKR